MLKIFKFSTLFLFSALAFSQTNEINVQQTKERVLLEPEAINQMAKKNVSVFVLHSYSQEYPWTHSQHQGFTELLKTDVSHVYDISVEYLDTKRISYNDVYAKQTADYLHRKYSDYMPDVIYVSDDNALTFALAHADSIFPNVPIFFSGINNYAIKKQLNPSRITGVFENKEIAPNLALIREMVKGKLDIVVIGDASETYRAIETEVKDELVNHPDIHATFVSSNNLDDLIGQIKQINTQFIFLTTLGMVKDANHHILSLPETLNAIKQSGDFVVISMEDAYLQPGVLGGWVTSGLRQGRAAAEMLSQYVNGIPLIAQPPIEASPNEYIFDDVELKRINLKLPQYIDQIATHLNVQPSFYNSHRKLVLSSLYSLVVFTLLGLIGALVVYARKNQLILMTSERLRESEERFRILFDSLPDPAWLVEGYRFVESNQAAVNVFGALNKAFFNNIHPASLSPEFQSDGEASFDKSERMIRLAQEIGIHRFEWVHKRLDNSCFDAEVTLVAITMQQHQAIYAIVHDISERKQAQEALLKTNMALAQSSSMLRTTLESTADGILTIDVDGNIRSFNRRFLEMWQIPHSLVKEESDQQLLRYVLDQLIDPKHFVEKVHYLYDHQEIESFDEIEFIDGRIFERYSMPQKLNQSIIGRVWSFRDVTERKTAEAKLQLAASVFLHAREGIVIMDASANILDINDTFVDITGYSRNELLGKYCPLFQSERQSNEFYDAIWHSLLHSKNWTGEMWDHRKNGELYAEMVTISVVYDNADKVQHYVALITDITPMKLYQEKIEHTAYYDSLTNLPNRILLADRLQQSIVQSKRIKHILAVVFLDLDGFKAVNDTHGHEVGDQLLIVISERMKIALREGDTLARIGGDEFIAVLVGLEQPQDFQPILDRLLNAASSKVFIDNIEVHVSASIGVTLFPQDNSDVDLLIRHADQAMYVAKQTGKNRYHLFDVDHDCALQTIHENLDRIQQALLNNEFVLYYQPKVNMKTGQITGAEALIRWQHPELGLLPPIKFLPLIENHSLSVDLGEWVIERALADIEIWQNSDIEMEMVISVNVSARQLQQDNFIERLTNLFATYPQVNPNKLEFEILETSALEDIESVSNIIKACDKLGINFSLDDFGTGYSSLTYLKQLPVKTLKIDQTFVFDMLDNADDFAIVESVIGLSNAFKRKVIAEGIETVAHGVALLSLGCEQGQGYVIAKPMLANELTKWVDNWHPYDTWTKN